MVTKCANPVCSAPFLYFHQGKLFRRENPVYAQGGKGNGSAKPTRHVEFYWLCDECAGRMTLAFEPGVGVRVRPRTNPQSTAA
jgi:hypothetical protein